MLSISMMPIKFCAPFYRLLLMIDLNGLTLQRGIQVHYPIDLIQNHRFQFYFHRRKNIVIQWLKLCHGNWPIPRSNHADILRLR